MTVSRLLARPMLASMFVVGGLNALKNAPALAAKAEKITDSVVPAVRNAGIPLPQDPVTLVRINAGVQLAAAAALASGHLPRLASATLAMTLVPTTVAGHQYWNESDPAQRTNQKLHFFKNVSMLGGLMIAAGDTAGKPGVAWRARHAAKDLKREARLAAAKVH